MVHAWGFLGVKIHIVFHHCYPMYDSPNQAGHCGYNVALKNRVGTVIRHGTETIPTTQLQRINQTLFTSEKLK